MSGEQQQRRSSPSEFLKGAIGKPVVVRLGTGSDYKGVLRVVDGYMNVVLEQTEEWADGQLKAHYGDAFVRGNNIIYISN